jgi:hypothetical protein
LNRKTIGLTIGSKTIRDDSDIAPLRRSHGKEAADQAGGLEAGPTWPGTPTKKEPHRYECRLATALFNVVQRLKRGPELSAIGAVFPRITS